MAQNPPPAEGQAITCGSTGPTGTHRYTEGQYRSYPDPAVAESWDPNWASAKQVNCRLLRQGAPMTTNPPPAEGQAISCGSTGPPGIHRYTQGQYRWYPDPPIAASWDPNWMNPKEFDCRVLKKGDPMPMKV